MSALGFVCYATCWACKFDSHYDEPTAHTWMDADDAEAKDIPYDPAVLTASHPCACRCSGGPGGCQPLGGAACRPGWLWCSRHKRWERGTSWHSDK